MFPIDCRKASFTVTWYNRTFSSPHQRLCIFNRNERKLARVSGKLLIIPTVVFFAQFKIMYTSSLKNFPLAANSHSTTSWKKEGKYPASKCALWWLIKQGTNAILAALDCQLDFRFRILLGHPPFSRLPSNAFPDTGSVGRIKKKKTVKSHKTLNRNG